MIAAESSTNASLDGTLWLVVLRLNTSIKQMCSQFNNRVLNTEHNVHHEICYACISRSLSGHPHPKNYPTCNGEASEIQTQRNSMNFLCVHHKPVYEGLMHTTHQQNLTSPSHIQLPETAVGHWMRPHLTHIRCILSEMCFSN
jgi:hypothetical protein